MSSQDAQPIHRMVLDTNVLLDWLVFGDSDALALADAMARRRVAWLATPPMLAELRSVLARPLANRWESARKHALTIDVEVQCTSCGEPFDRPSRLVCRDATDQMFVDLALARAPAWLVSHDRALLALRRKAAGFGVTIGTPAQAAASLA